MAGSLAALLISVLLALFGGSEKEGKKRSMGLAVIASAIGAISLLIAFPEILTIGGEPVVIWIPVVVGLIGVIICLVAKGAKNLTGLILLVGVTMVAWALFRWLPTGPAAFQFLGEHMGLAGKEAGTGFSGWWDILFGSKK